MHASPLPALPSPHGSAASSARGRRQGSSLVASGPLSARGINPERHPALHEKELAEMKRLVEMHCQVWERGGRGIGWRVSLYQDAAEVVSRTGIVR